eukprot:COSAG02_NODE_1100_length_14582_cov_130.690672_18_plen_115_part_00
MKAHRDNFTAISPPLYNIHIDGTFARIAGDSAGSYAELFPYVRELAALGLEVHPLIAGYDCAYRPDLCSCSVTNCCVRMPSAHVAYGVCGVCTCGQATQCTRTGGTRAGPQKVH